MSIVRLMFVILQKNCSKELKDSFLVYNLLFVIRKMRVRTSGELLFSLLIINKYYTPKMFLLRIRER